MPFWPESRSVTFYHSSCQRSDELYCPFDQLGDAVAGTINAANMRGREDVPVSLFFPFPSPAPTGILYSPQFCSLEKTKMAAGRKLTDLTEK